MASTAVAPSRAAAIPRMPEPQPKSTHPLPGRGDLTDGFQAQGRGWVGPGAESEARVEQEVDGLGIRRLEPAWANPQIPAKAHGLVVLHPLALPVLVFEDFYQRLIATGECPQCGENWRHNGVGAKQARHAQVAPQRRLPDTRLQQRFVAGILKRDRQRPCIQECVFELFRLPAIAGDGRSWSQLTGGSAVLELAFQVVNADTTVVEGGVANQFAVQGRVGGGCLR